MLESILQSSVTWLINGVVIGILFQPNAPRLYAAFVFSALMYAHEYFMSDLDGILYYGSIVLFNLIAVVLLGLINPTPKMVIRLQLILLIFALVNFMGWIMWMLYMPPLIYDLACAILFASTLITLILRDKQDVGGFSMDSWISCFHFNGFAMRYFNFTNEKKI